VTALKRALWIGVIIVAAVLVLWLVTFVILGSGDESGPTISMIR
jgi:hypothetical protein